MPEQATSTLKLISVWFGLVKVMMGLPYAVDRVEGIVNRFANVFDAAALMFERNAPAV